MKSYDDLAACAARYAAAREQLTEASDALRHFEAVLRARVTLAECLIAAGWSPPEGVEHLLAIDRQLLSESHGAIETGRVDILS
jgi:hypothetical protein